MARMKAKQKFPYAGKPLDIGDPFDTENERDANLLEAVGLATRAEAKPEKAKRETLHTREYNRRDMQPEGRDMKAEDE